MNQRLLIGIIILAGIGSITAVSAYSGSISAAQGNFNNVLVTGSCVGCSSEGSFTSYNTIVLNTTATNADTTLNNVMISNSGNILLSGSSNNQYITLAGVTSFTNSSYGTSTGITQISQSSTGKYQVIINNSGSGTISVFKNGVYLQALGINLSQFSTSSLSDSQVTTGVSNDGKYIVVAGKDTGGASDRILVFQGS